MIVDKNLIDQLFKQAEENPRKRTNYDMRTSPEDGSQRMLNAMQPGTEEGSGDGSLIRFIACQRCGG